MSDPTPHPFSSPTTPSGSRWPKSKRCQADTGGKHRWEYEADRSARECRKCGVRQEARCA